MIWLWHHQNDAAPFPFRTAPTNLYYKHIEYTTDFKKEHDIKQFRMSFFGRSLSRINCTRSRINFYPDPENKYDTFHYTGCRNTGLSGIQSVRYRTEKN
jgi:hypothetical protein